MKNIRVHIRVLLQCVVAECCSMLQCVAQCCSVLQSDGEDTCL